MLRAMMACLHNANAIQFAICNQSPQLPIPLYNCQSLGGPLGAVKPWPTSTERDFIVFMFKRQYIPFVLLSRISVDLSKRALPRASKGRAVYNILLDPGAHMCLKPFVNMQHSTSS